MFFFFTLENIQTHSIALNLIEKLIYFNNSIDHVAFIFINYTD